MAKVTVKLNSEGVKELLKSQAIMSTCAEHAYSALRKLGPGYEVTTMVGKNRVNAEIATVDFDAMRDNMRNNSILKALR